MTQATEVLSPTSADEAVAQFGDGSGVTVIGGGTIVVPDITYGRRSPRKGAAPRSSRAGHALGRRNDRDGRRGPAGPPALELAQDVEALAECALNVADYEVRRQGTVGGNVCATAATTHRAATCKAPSSRSRRRRAPSARAARRASRSRSFLAHREDRLLLDLSFDKPRRRRSPRSSTRTPTSTPCSRSRACARTGGETRLAATGVAGHGTRLRAAEAAASDPEAAGEAALGDVTLGDDALASAWYRGRALPVLVRRVPREARGGGMNLTRERDRARRREHAPHDLARRAPRGARRDEPQGGLRAGRLRRVHGARRRRAAARVPHGRRAVDGAEVTTVEGMGAASRSRRSSRRSRTTTPRSAASARAGC